MADKTLACAALLIATACNGTHTTSCRAPAAVQYQAQGQGQSTPRSSPRTSQGTRDGGELNGFNADMGEDIAKFRRYIRLLENLKRTYTSGTAGAPEERDIQIELALSALIHDHHLLISVTESMIEWPSAARIRGLAGAAADAHKRIADNLEMVVTRVDPASNLSAFLRRAIAGHRQREIGSRSIALSPPW